VQRLVLVCVQIELDLDTGAPAARPERPSEKFAVIDTGLWECKSCQYAPPTPPPPRKQQQDWILKCLQGGRAHPLAACGVAVLCCSPPVLVGKTLSSTLRSQHAALCRERWGRSPSSH
jgi:hypothetical protein